MKIIRTAWKWFLSAGDTAKEILYIALLKWAVSRCHTAVVLFQKPPTTLEGLFILAMKVSKCTITKLDSTLDSISLYEQAKAHLIKNGHPVTEFISTRLELMYNGVGPCLNYFISKELKK